MLKAHSQELTEIIPDVLTKPMPVDDMARLLGQVGATIVQARPRWADMVDDEVE